tara:strand:+ start:34393 stop:35397 length:1005 start_codon:yes stop_codon:yes gene_type:complete
MANKVFRAEKIRANEICGVTGNFVVQGNIIASGESTYVSGVTGYFDTLIANNFEQAQDQVYAFRFGGPPIEVPDRLPVVTASGLRLAGQTATTEDPDPELYTGLASGHNFVFVKETGSFASGEHIIINPGGLYGDGYPQEEHTVSGYADYYVPTGCCNAQVSGFKSAGNDGLLHTDVISGGYNFVVGDLVKISGSNAIYTVTGTGSSVTEGIRSMDFDPVLEADVPDSGCICLVQPTLFLEDNLENNYPTGTIVANVFANSVAKDCSYTPYGNVCYDAQYLYMEVFTGMGRWMATGYREWFVAESGINVHITGAPDGTVVPSILTFEYPHNYVR